MQLTSIAPVPTPVSAPVSAPFNILYFGINDNSAVEAETKVLDLASKHKVGFTDFEITPAFLESNPPQGTISGNVVGEASAVKQALAALEELGQQI